MYYFNDIMRKQPYIHHIQRLAWLLLPVMMFASCMKDRSDEFVPYTGGTNDTAWAATISNNAAVYKIDTLFSSSIASSNVLVDSVSPETGGTVTFSDGTVLYCPPGFCATAGNSGKVKIELLFLHKKGDFIRFAKPTSSYDKVLEASGVFRVRITQNGSPLQLKPGMFLALQMQADVSNTATHLFYGDSVADYPGSFTWTPATDPISDIKNIAGGYQVWITQTGWISCQYPANYSSKARLTAILPPNYTNTNTAVYAVFKNSNTVVRLSSELSSRSFFAGIPVGTELTLVSLSKRGSYLYWDSASVTVSAAVAIQLHPQQKTAAEIEALLNAL